MAPLRGLRDPIERNASSSLSSKPRSSRSVSQKSSTPSTVTNTEKPQQNLETLLDELDDETQQKDLTQLKQQVCAIIDEYPVRNVLRVFSSAEKLLHCEEAKSAELGLDIVAELAFQPECTPANRLHFFSRVVRDGLTKHYTEFPSHLFSILTDNGRQLEGFEQLLPYLIPFLLKEADCELAEKDVRRTAAREAGRTVATSLDLIVNIIKYNARFFTDINIADLIQGTFELRERLAYDDPEKICDIIGALLTYSHIPKDAVQISIRTLCFKLSWGSTQQQKEKLRTKTFKTFSFFLSTHLKDLAIESLLLRLEADNLCIDEAEGAVALLQWSVTNARTRRMIELDITRLMNALARQAPNDASTYASLRLGLIQVLFEDADMRRKILLEPDWTYIQQAIVQNANAPMDSGAVPLSKEDGTLDRFMQDQENRRATVRQVILSLERLEGISLQQSRTLRRIALHVAPWLTQKQARKLISAYQPSSFRISVGNWLVEIKELSLHFIYNTSCHLSLRQKALGVIKSAWQTAQQLGETEAMEVCRHLVIDALDKETNYIFRGNLVHCLLLFTTGVDDPTFYRTLAVLVKSAQTECYHEPTETAFVPQSGPESTLGSNSDEQDKTERELESEDLAIPSVLPDASLVVLLMRSSVDQLERTRAVYSEILTLLGVPDRAPEATVMLLRGLFRMRSDLDHRIFFLVRSEGESLAKVLNRNADSPFQQSRRSSLQSGCSFSPPVWKYGDIHGLPEDPPPTVSSVLRSESTLINGVDCSLDMEPWLEVVIRMVSEGCDWEVYSYVIVHLGAQLSNQSLFAEVVPQIRSLRNIICKQIQTQSVPKPPEASNLRQGDVALCLYHNLTTIIGYHWRFPRKENEDTVSTFVRGLTLWDRTTVPCVNALTLSCYELPISLGRDLVRIVAQMSTIVTKSEAAVHVLEFLAGLSRIGDLVNQFHGDEIKTVFGVCFSYIEYAKGKKFDEAQQRSRASANATRIPSIVETQQQRPSTEDIPQYVFALSYHVITFWFLALGKEDQEKHFPWMEQRLLSPDQSGEVTDEALITVDHLWRVTQGKDDAPPLPPLDEDSEASAESITQTWVSEFCILTIKCYSDTGIIDVVERRSSGTDHSRFVHDGPGPISPEAIFEKRFSKTINGPFKSSLETCILPATDAIRRSLGIFDRISTIDYFKTGVIYIGENQTKESEILPNISGSPDYSLFVMGLGERLDLLNCRQNVAGLDTSEGLFDGRSTYQHHNSITILNYHITTMMPTNWEMDPQCTRKKSHIGNDYVNIVFNNSGQEFDFNTFPSAFNYVYIVIIPEARQTFIQTRTRRHNSGWYEDSWFKVRLLTRADFPDISSAAETKVVSGAALASYVRNLALNAEEFCRVWGNRSSGEFPSSWRSRLQQIRMLRERNVPKKEGQ